MRNFLKGSTVLALGDLITKLLSIIYLIPLQKIDPMIPAIMAMLLIPFAFAIVFTTLGINVILNVEFIKYYKKDADKLKQTLVAGIVILSVFSFAAIVGMFGGAEYLMQHIIGPHYRDVPYYDDLVGATRILSLGTILYAIGVYLRSLLTSFGEYKIISLSYVTEQVLKIGLTLFFTYYFIVVKQMPVGVSAYILAISIVVSMATTPMLYAWKLAKGGYFHVFKEGKHSFELSIYKNIFYASVIFFASSLYMSAFDQIDLMLLPKLMHDPKEIAMAQSEYFSLSMKIVMIPINLSTAFVSVMVREIQVEGRNKKVDLDNMLTIVIVYAGIMMLGVWAVGSDVYHMMYGRAYFNVIAFQALIIPFYIVRNVISGYVVTNDGKVPSILTSAVLILVVKYLGDIALFQIFGLAGYSYASVLAILVSLGILIIPNHNLFLVNREVVMQKALMIVKIIVALIVISYIKDFIDMQLLHVYRGHVYGLFIKGIIVLIISGAIFYPDYKHLKG